MFFIFLVFWVLEAKEEEGHGFELKTIHTLAYYLNTN